MKIHHRAPDPAAQGHSTVYGEKCADGLSWCTGHGFEGRQTGTALDPHATLNQLADSPEELQGGGMDAQLGGSCHERYGLQI